MAIRIGRKLAEDIADYLAEKIIQMQIRPGERIVEAKVREEFDVSNGPVREALQILETIHLVELIPRRGAWVTEMSPEFLRCLYDVMSELVGLFIRRLCENRTEEQLNQLLDLERKARQCAEKKNIEGYFEAMTALMRIGLEASGNPVLARMILDWMPNARRANFLFLSQSEYSLDDSIKNLQEIKEYVIEKNGRMGEKIVQSYLDRQGKRVLEITRRYFAEDRELAG